MAEKIVPIGNHTFAAELPLPHWTALTGKTLAEIVEQQYRQRLEWLFATEGRWDGFCLRLGYHSLPPWYQIAGLVRERRWAMVSPIVDEALPGYAPPLLTVEFDPGQPEELGRFRRSQQQSIGRMLNQLPSTVFIEAVAPMIFALRQGGISICGVAEGSASWELVPIADTLRRAHWRLYRVGSCLSVVDSKGAEVAAWVEAQVAG